MARVALIGENSIGYVNTLLDIWNNGDCAVLLDWRIPAQRAFEMMSEAGVKKCYIEESLFSKIQKNIPSLIQFVIYEKINKSADYLPDQIYVKFAENYSKKEAVIIYSSGTTGKSKGVILTHYAINTNADAIIDYIKPDNTDCFYMVKTISHASSLVGELLVALKTKTPIVIAPIIVPPRYTLANIFKFKITIMCINPTLLRMYMKEYTRQKEKYDLSSLKEIYIHGAKTSLKTCEAAAIVFGNCKLFYEYGLTEAGPRVSTQKNSSKCIDSVGKPIKGVSVKILDSDGNELPQNERGAIHVKTPSQYLGYVIGKNKFDSYCTGWMNTGDVGYFDDYGELHIVGRADDVIIINAHKIYPSEVEKQIIACSDIDECAVTMVEYNDNKVIGCLYAGGTEIDLNTKEKLNTVLMSHEIPRVFLKCESLPRTLTGKVLSDQVRAHIKNFLTHK